MWEELDIVQDPAFLERDRLRKAGIPVTIAETERLLIRETVLSDVPVLYGIWQQPHVGDYMKPLQPTLEAELAFMEAYICHAYSFYDFGLWTVIQRQRGEIIGRAGLFSTEILEEGIELGYMIGPAWQRQGYAKECGEAILSYASAALDLHEIHLLSDRRNLASLQTACTLGFEKRGILHQAEKELVHFTWRDRLWIKN